MNSEMASSPIPLNVLQTLGSKLNRGSPPLNSGLYYSTSFSDLMLELEAGDSGYCGSVCSSLSPSDGVCDSSDLNCICDDCCGLSLAPSSPPPSSSIMMVGDDELTVEEISSPSQQQADYHQLAEGKLLEKSQALLASCSSSSLDLVPVVSSVVCAVRDRNMEGQLDPTTLRGTLRRNESFARCCFHANERKVLVLYTGGTIGMVRSKKGALACVPNMLEQTVRKFPHLHDEAYAESRFADAVGKSGNTPLILPELPGEAYRIAYTIYEYDPLLDSSNMTMDDWIRIARDIKNNYQNFDGFVVLHGTDTMAYTASALSFMMENLGKSVVITGSQIPLFESRSDGRDNFLGALIMAGSYYIPEVTCYFGHKLFRGNRITKVSSDSLNAFDSPNMQPLASMGINIEVNYNLVFRPRKISSFQLNTSLSRNVGLLRLFPSITAETVKHFLEPPTMGVVLQTYGAGNFPTNRTDLLRELQKASERGVLIVNCTQCGHGSVSAIYETGQTTEAAGVIPGWDMTPEAALTKLSYVLGRSDWDIETKRAMIQSNLRGELTKSTKSSPDLFTRATTEYLAAERRASLAVTDGIPALPGVANGDKGGPDVVHRIVQMVSKSLKLYSPEEMEGIRRVLAPALSCALVAQVCESEYQVDNLEALFGHSESEISVGDIGTLGRTPLHYACALNDKPTVEYLLRKGASVHVRDSRGFSPLREAIEFEAIEVIPILRQCGAHLTQEPLAIGGQLCQAAAQGQLKRLECYKEAGANLNQVDTCGRTPLQAAVESNNTSVAQWLLQNGANPNIRNRMGFSPLDIAQAMGDKDLVEIVRSSNKLSTNGINGHSFASEHVNGFLFTV